MPLAKLDEEKFKKHFLQPGDLIITRSGTCGRTAIFESFHLPVIPGAFSIRFRLCAKADNRFFRYYFNSSTGHPRVIALTTGSVQPNLTSTALLNLKVPLPPIDEQKAIARILGSLDDKIELNQQMNHTLEMIARALFKSWFINFDPVRAKKDGRQPAGMDAETAALFPAEFEDSPLGKIPKGWKVEPLDGIADFLNGLALQKYPPEGDEYLPVIKIVELRKGITESSGKASPNLDEKYIIQDGDVLFSWSGSLEAIIWCGGKGALNQHLFKVTSKKYPKWFYYEWVKFHLPDFQAIAASKATTMGHIQRHHLTATLGVVPPKKFIEAADKRMAQLLEKFISNNLESRTIASIRDALLPKLLSGEVGVKDVEKFLVEEGNA